MKGLKPNLKGVPSLFESHTNRNQSRDPDHPEEERIGREIENRKSKVLKRKNSEIKRKVREMIEKRNRVIFETCDVGESNSGRKEQFSIK